VLNHDWKSLGFIVIGIAGLAFAWYPQMFAGVTAWAVALLAIAARRSDQAVAVGWSSKRS